MTKEEWAFNEWMRRFIEEPETFQRDFQSVQEFVAESAEGVPSYGADMSAYLAALMEQAPDSEADRVAAFEGWQP